ncbi:MAG: SdrD B-like domain-containing protein [Caldilineaceae bacterium]
MNHLRPNRERKWLVLKSSLLLKLLFSLLFFFLIGGHWSQSAYAADMTSPLAATSDQKVITNTVTVGSTTTDPNSLNNTANQSTTVVSQADLVLSKSDGVGSMIPGTTVTYTIIVTNAGPSNVSNAQVTDNLPAIITSASWSCTSSSGSNCDSSSGTGNINATVDLAPNGTATFVVIAQVSSTATGTLVNTATVTPPPTTTDPNPGNNSQTDTDNLLTGTLTGSVFIDANHDQTQNGSEGLGGVTVIITTSVGTTLSVTTDSNGLFTVTVPIGNTQVDVRDSDLPAGVVQVAGSDPSTVNVPSGGTVQDLNGYEQRGLLYGHIYEDKDGNGVQTAGEPNLSGVSVVITDAFGLTQTVMTDGSGNYTATVATGSASSPYTATVDVVESSLPAGYLQTDGSDPTVVTGLVAGGQRFEENNGYQIRGQVVGVVYMDQDGDGDYTAGVDTPINVTLIITDSNGVGHSVTTVNGAYTLTVPTGNTQVDIVDSSLPNGVVLTGGSSDPTTVVVPGGGTARDDTGYVILSSIGDRVWLDLNGDGVQDSNEPGLEGVVVTLTAASGAPLTVTTGSNGNYTFGNLVPRRYTVTVDSATLPLGVTQTYDRDNTMDNRTSATISSATVITNADFGYRGNASIGDLVWHDLNGDGVKDSNEPGFAGIVITLTFPSGHVITTTTNVSGTYTFAGLIPGTYTVDVDDTTLPAGAVRTSSNDTFSITLSAGTNNTSADFGYQQRGQVYGHLFEDINGNGVQDNGEPNLSGVSVIITNTLGVTQTVTTDSSGNYTATVPMGSTTVDVVDSTLPAGSVQTAGNPVDTITVQPGVTNDAGIDGYQVRGIVDGRVYEDRNNNGVYDPAIDQALANVAVLITDRNGVTSTVQTDSLGYFSKTVPAGTTSVDVNNANIPANLALENGFVDPQTVTVPGAGTASTNFPYVETLKIDLDTNTPTVAAGTQATYTLVVRNPSNQLLTNVALSDTLPAGFTYASSTVDASNASRTATGDPAVGDNTVLWNEWSINPGGIVTITLVVNVASSVDPNTYDTTAYAYSTQSGLVDDVGTTAQDSNTPYGQDPEPDEDVTIITSADLSVAKYDDRDPVAAGTLLTYTIVVSNAGPSDARNVIITDTLPGDVTYVSDDAGCSESAGTVTCNVGTIAVNSSRTITIVVRVSSSVLTASGNAPAMVAAPAVNDAVSSAATLESEGGQASANAGALTAQLDSIATPSISTASATVAAMSKLSQATSSTWMQAVQQIATNQSSSTANLARSWTTATEWLATLANRTLYRNAVPDGIKSGVTGSGLF